MFRLFMLHSERYKHSLMRGQLFCLPSIKSSLSRQISFLVFFAVADFFPIIIVIFFRKVLTIGHAACQLLWASSRLILPTACTVAKLNWTSVQGIRSLKLNYFQTSRGTIRVFCYILNWYLKSYRFITRVMAFLTVTSNIKR